ncbi:MAG: glucose/mannose transport system permease protein [Verrucomicrobiota bacterium]|jgi:glucose/mannose transport system permease protein|nr:glucose/mannose transport system permease protein [Verrucomicrobiota bacterium]MEA3164295.1 glucose/mannose transport system permease protein [Verrucomicrobiota bacterium]MEA3206651.1 glucose/mannose transport system permease protein [Verrucomicrobiota bacterium]
MQISSINFQQSLPRTIWDWLILGFLICCALFFLMPIYVMVVTGLKQAQNVSLSTMWQLPVHLSGGGFYEAWRRLYPNLGNSLQLTIPATIISSILGAINGYIFSKWKFRGANTLFAVMVFGMFIPYQSILIPLIQFLEQIKLYGTIGGLILVHVVYGLPICTLIFRNFFAGIPDELVEAARLDGAGVIRIFLLVMLPLALPAFVVVGIFQFTNIWNDFLFGVTILPNPNAQPVTVALNNLSGSFSVDWNVVMAGAVIVALPTALIYILLGRFFVRGLLAGSVKG